MTEFMDHGSTASARLECRDDIGVADLLEFMALPEESTDVITKRFARLLPATLQVPRVVEAHIRALGVAGEVLLESFPTINHVSWQVVHPCPCCVSRPKISNFAM
jgi:hypothetical protein